MVTYRPSAVGVTADQLEGFFEGWPKPPTTHRHLEILRGSDHVVLAVDPYIPLLEVLPDYRQQGIGSELVRQMLEKLRGFHTVDLVCDPELQGFYARFGMKPYTAMIIRNLDSTG